MYRGWGVSLRFATETRTSAHDAVDDAYTAWKEGKSEISPAGGGGNAGRRMDEGENREKGVIKSKVLSQRGSRHFAVACSAREMTSAKMADLRGAAGSPSSLPSVHAYTRHARALSIDAMTSERILGRLND